VGLKSNTNDHQFEKDYDEILKKLKRLIRDSQDIKMVVEKRLNTIEPDQIMVLLQELIPKAIRDLSQIYRFLNKYGYNDNVEQIQKDDWPEKNRPKQK